jgi:FAD-linked sulfhydryl oxidase
MEHQNRSWSKHNKADEEEDCVPCEALGVFKQQLFSAKTKKTTENVEPNEDKNYWEMKPPPDTIELGNCSWTLLHTMAAYYPSAPSSQKKEEVKNFLHSFSKVYPCSYCAKDFQQILKENPPQLNNQKDFSQWLCRVR